MNLRLDTKYRKILKRYSEHASFNVFCKELKRLSMIITLIVINLKIDLHMTQHLYLRLKLFALKLIANPWAPICINLTYMILLNVLLLEPQNTHCVEIPGITIVTDSENRITEIITEDDNFIVLYESFIIGSDKYLFQTEQERFNDTVYLLEDLFPQVPVTFVTPSIGYTIYEVTLPHSVIQNVDAQGNPIDGNELTDWSDRPSKFDSAPVVNNDSAPIINKPVIELPEYQDTYLILHNVTDVIQVCKSRADLVTNAIQYVQKIIPENYWVHSKAELLNSETSRFLNNYVDKFQSELFKELPVSQHIAHHVYTTAISTYQVSSAVHITDPVKIQKIFYDTLENKIKPEVLKELYAYLDNG